MVNIHVGDYRITNDNLQFLLSKVVRDSDTKEIERVTVKDKKTGEEQEQDKERFIGYYGRLKTLYKAIVLDYVLSDETTIDSLLELKEAVRTITDLFDTATKDIEL